MESQKRQQLASRCWRLSAKQLLLSWQPLEAKAHHLQQLPAQPPTMQTGTTCIQFRQP